MNKGKKFELKVARLLRRKGFNVFRDSRSGAGTNKSDILDWTREVPFNLELKDQNTIKIREWFNQSKNASSLNPAVVFHADEEILVTLRFGDFLDLIKENKDLTSDLNKYRGHIAKFKACPNHHIADDEGFCLQKECEYRRGI